MRSERGAYLVDGPLLVSEALDAGAAVQCLYVEVDASRDVVHDLVERASSAGVRICEVVPGALAKVLDLGAPQSVVAVVDQRQVEVQVLLGQAIAQQRPLLVLVALSDPGNVGTLVRVAEAAGCAGVALVGHCADLHNPKTVRATAGAVFRVPVCTVDDLSELIDAGLDLVGTAGIAGVAPEDARLVGAVGVVVGSEAHGLSPDSLSACSQVVAIPMEGSVESLNAAVAGAVVVFEAARQRRAARRGAESVEPSGDATSSVSHNGDPTVTGRSAPDRPEPEQGSPTR